MQQQPAVSAANIDRANLPLHHRSSKQPAGQRIMSSNNECMNDTLLKSVPKYYQTQISIQMATKQGENIQF